MAKTLSLLHVPLLTPALPWMWWVHCRPWVGHLMSWVWLMEVLSPSKIGQSHAPSPVSKTYQIIPLPPCRLLCLFPHTWVTNYSTTLPCFSLLIDFSSPFQLTTTSTLDDFATLVNQLPQLSFLLITCYSKESVPPIEALSIGADTSKSNNQLISRDIMDGVDEGTNACNY